MFVVYWPYPLSAVIELLAITIFIKTIWLAIFLSAWQYGHASIRKGFTESQAIVLKKEKITL